MDLYEFERNLIVLTGEIETINKNVEELQKSIHELLIKNLTLVVKIQKERLNE